MLVLQAKYCCTEVIVEVILVAFLHNLYLPLWEPLLATSKKSSSDKSSLPLNILNVSIELPCF